MDAKPRLTHESFDNRADRDCRYYVLSYDYANVDRYTDQELVEDNVVTGVKRWKMVYYVCYTPKVGLLAAAPVVADDYVEAVVPDGIL